MKKWIWIGVVAVVVIFFYATYNGFVNKEEGLKGAWADVETQYQRRADLIPNLVNSVKGYMDHESAIIDAITESRQQLLNAATPAEKAEADAALTEALGSFNVIVENYPDLKADSSFVQLMDELAGTENRIATARRDYNTAVKDYNQIIKKLPGKLFASLFGFEPADYFTAAEGSTEVPDVTF